MLLLLPGSSAEAAYPGHNGHILFVRSGPHERAERIWKMNRRGGSQQRMTLDARRDTRPVWSPDGSRFAFVRRNLPTVDQLVIRNADGSHLRVVGTFEGVYSDAPPTWSPDGSRIAIHAYLFCQTDFGPGIAVIDWRTREQKVLCAGFTNSLSWSPTGGLIAFSSGASIRTMTPTGRHVRRLTPEGVKARSPDWSPDGRRLVWVSLKRGGENNADILVMDRTGGHVRRLTATQHDDADPAYSPNGERIVFSRCCFGTSDTSELFVMHADGSHIRRLTHNNADDYQPDWQPR